MPDPRDFLPPPPWEGPPIPPKRIKREQNYCPGSWVDKAWEELRALAQSRGIQVDNVISRFSESEHAGFPTIKFSLSGYYLIEASRATKEIIDEVYYSLLEGLHSNKKEITEYWGEPGMSFEDLLERERIKAGLPAHRIIVRPSEGDDVIDYLEDIFYLEGVFIDGMREDKVRAIKESMEIRSPTGGLFLVVNPGGPTTEAPAALITDLIDLIQGKPLRHYTRWHPWGFFPPPSKQ